MLSLFPDKMRRLWVARVFKVAKKINVASLQCWAIGQDLRTARQVFNENECSACDRALIMRAKSAPAFHRELCLLQIGFEPGKLGGDRSEMANLNILLQLVEIDNKIIFLVPTLPPVPLLAPIPLFRLIPTIPSKTLLIPTIPSKTLFYLDRFSIHQPVQATDRTTFHMADKTDL